MDFGCEAELYTSDLRFKVFDDSSNSSFLDCSNKRLKTAKLDDYNQSLSTRLNKLIAIYQSKFRELKDAIHQRQVMAGLETDPNLELHLAIAVYLSSYANTSVMSSSFVRGLPIEAQNFLRVVLVEILGGEKEDQDLEEFREVMVTDFEAYRTATKRIVRGDVSL